MLAFAINIMKVGTMQNDGSDNSHSEQKQDETEQVMVPAQHPFKGKHIDFMC